MKRKNCSNTRGYACGRTCISAKYECRLDGLTGQSITIANNFTDIVKIASGSPSVSNLANDIMSQLGNIKVPKPPESSTIKKPKSPSLEVVDTTDESDSYSDFAPGTRKIDTDGHLRYSADLFDELGIEEDAVSAVSQYVHGTSGKVKAASAGRDEYFNSASGEIEPFTENDAWAKEDADHIDNVIKKMPKYNGKIYSGLPDADIAKDWKPGDEITLDSINSFSSSESVAEQFAGKSKTVLEVETNTRGADIKQMVINAGGLTMENEVLVPAKSKYKVKSINNGRIILTEA